MQKEIAEHEFLRAYVETGDESAFASLVEIHLPLIYSAALRQTDNDSGLAIEITQNVWTKFAKESPKLIAHPSLSGWLHATTRNQALAAIRERRRRLNRETYAASMNSPTEQSDPTWDQLRPFIDEALLKISDEDRQVLLLRFFERHGLKHIGDRLKVTDNAARMRVNRALTRLRDVLGRMGITSSAAAIERLMGSHVIVAVPPELFIICRSVAIGTHLKIQSPGKAMGLRRMILPRTWKTVSLLCSVAVILWLTTKIDSYTLNTAVPSQEREVETTAEPVSNTKIASTGKTLRNTLRLTVVDTNNQRIEGLQIEPLFDTHGGISRLQPFEDDLVDGSLVIAIPEDWTQLQIAIGREGFADKTLTWSKDHLEEIPATYRLMLEPGVKLSGLIVDENNRPISNAVVAAWLSDPIGKRPELMGRQHGIFVTNRANGRWETVRVSEAALRHSHLTFQHPEYQNLTNGLFISEEREQASQLLDGTHVQVLRRGWRIVGSVKDPNGQPIAKARVSLGFRTRVSSDHEIATDSSGKFSFRQVEPGINQISIDQTPFASGTWSVDVTNSEQFVSITLSEVKHPLRLRIVDADRKPIPMVSVWLFERSLLNTWVYGADIPTLDVNYSAMTDELGNLTWKTPPDQRMAFQAGASGFLRTDFQVSPTDEIQEITLQPALRIVAAATDSVTGLPVKFFQMVPGGYAWSSSINQGNGHYSWPVGAQGVRAGSDGRLEAEFQEPYFGLQPQFPYVFRFQAEGYMHALSRRVLINEGLVHLDMVLKPAPVLSRRLVSPEGRPVVDAWVGFPGMVNGLRFSSEGPGMHGFGLGDSAQKTGIDGDFMLPATDEFGGLVAIHPDGFAVVSTEEVRGNSNITLQPWTMIEGSFDLTEGQPIPDTLDFQIGILSKEHAVAPRYSEDRIRVSETGQFRIPKAIVGHGKLIFRWSLTKTNQLAESAPPMTLWATQEPFTNPPGRSIRVRIQHGSQTVPDPN